MARRMIYLNISLCSTLRIQTFWDPRTNSGRISKISSSVVVMLMPLMRTKQRASKNSKNSATWCLSLLFGVPMICCLNIVRLIRPITSIVAHLFVVPVKYEQVVFCGLSDFQLSLYRLFISSPEIKALLRGAHSQPLKAINILKKLCNHPELLDLPNDLQGCENLIPEGFKGAGNTSNARGRDKDLNVHCEWSGKFLVLERCACCEF